MRRTLILLLVISVVAIAGHGQGEFVAEGVSVGSTAIYFTATTIDTIFQGTMDFTGSLPSGKQAASFSATGNAHGAGLTDSNTLATELWILFVASGEVEDGTAISMRGGITVYGEDVDFATMSLGSGPGVFFAIIDLPGETFWITGTLTSTASGEFVVPEDPLAMQVDGGGTFSLEGSSITQEGDPAEHLPWDPSTWPPELHEEVLAILAGLETEPEEEPEEEP
jgi:hypothetical protein